MSRDYQYDPAITPFAATALGYAPNNALWLAAAANLAYEDETTIRSAVGQWGFNRFRFLHARGRVDAAGPAVPVDTQGYVCTGDQALLIAFRGTEPLQLKDWFTDLMARTVPAPSGTGKTHKGFTAAFAAVWPQLEQALAEQHDGRRPIWITGHSLGGALGLLATAQLQATAGRPVQGLYTFGQPRAGDRDFAKSVNRAMPERVFRFVNDNDVVPHLPPPGFLLKYWHIEQEAYYNSTGDLVFGVPWWKRLVGLVKGSFQELDQLSIDVLADHKMDRYVALARRHSAAPG